MDVIGVFISWFKLSINLCFDSFKYFNSSILFSITSIIRLKLCSNTPISSFFLLSTALILYSPFAISLDTLLNLTKGLVNFFDIIYIPADKIINIIKSIIMKNL